MNILKSYAEGLKKSFDLVKIVNIIFGATIDDSMHDQIKIAVIATGFDRTRQTLKEFVSPIINAPKPKTEIAENAPKVPESQGTPQDDNDDDAWNIPAFLRQRN